MAVKQIEWKQKVNRETGKWWLRALFFGVVCTLLVWGSLRLAGTVLGMREFSGSLKFWVLALAISVGTCFLQEWQQRQSLSQKDGSTQRSSVWKALKVVGLLVGALFVVWFIYYDGGKLWSGLQRLGETYLQRLSVQTPNYKLRRSETNALQPALEFGI